jgi:hypothetical protein
MADGSAGAEEPECCFLACHCWIDVRFELGLTHHERLLMLLPVSCYNIRGDRPFSARRRLPA